MSVYLKMASKHGYLVIVSEPNTPWKLDAEELAKKNSHNVTKDVILNKIKAFSGVSPMYFGWFLDQKVTRDLTEKAKMWFKLCLNSAQFERDLAAVTFNYLSKFHCTSKFCGKENKCVKYAKKVQNYIGKAQNLEIIGFVITPETFSARVRLDEEQLSDLWAQNDDEEVSADRFCGEENAKRGKKKNKKLTRREKEERDLLESEMENFSLNDSFELIENRGKGRRAHVTLATKAGAASVLAGLDALAAAKAEREELESEKVELNGGSLVLARFSPNLHVGYLKETLSLPVLFNSCYW